MIANKQDAVGGAVFTLVGLGIGAYTLAHYQIGTLTRLGPGGFPLFCAIGMALFGLLTLLSGLKGEKVGIEVNWIPMITILAAIALFAFGIGTVGMIPTIVVTTLVALAPNNDFPLIWRLVMAAVLAVIAVLIFDALLGLPIKLAAWPWS
ncbi:tripartite tricarboxylate transporter TctB family protein [Amorphus sp. MBR-141]